MSQAFRNSLLSLRDMIVSAGPLALLPVLLLALAYWWLQPTPPKTVVLATGPAQSAYEEFGKRYQQALAVEGITVQLLPSEGSLTNLQLLREGHHLVGLSRQSQPALTEQARASQVPVEQWTVDLSQADSAAAQLADWLAQRQPQDYASITLINNAGVAGGGCGISG